MYRPGSFTNSIGISVPTTIAKVVCAHVSSKCMICLHLSGLFYILIITMGLFSTQVVEMKLLHTVEEFQVKMP